MSGGIVGTTNPNTGSSLQLLDLHQASGTESTYTFTPGSALNSAKYSAIVIKISGSATASLALNMVLNGDSGNMAYFGQRMTGSAVANITASAQSVIQIASTSIISAATLFDGEIIINLDSTVGKILRGTSMMSAGGVGVELLGWYDSQGATNSITSINFATSTSTWATGTNITTYGVKNV